jgi:hypothetical protein
MIDTNDFMSGSEVKALLGSTDKTDKFLRRNREKYWVEGVHYVQPIQRVLYIRPMILDWVLNHKSNPMVHQDAMEAWVAKTQKRNPRRKAS